MILSKDRRARTKRSIDRAVAILRAGGVVAFPTETVYGLGANAENEDAVRRVFELKGRPPTHPLIVHLGDAADLGAWSSDAPAMAHRLAERFWPGPLTLIVERSRRVPDVVTGGLSTVGLRVPDHPVALALLRAFRGGIAAPSANRFGAVSPTTAAHVREDFGSEIDLVLDGGACRVGLESTIVDLSSGAPAVLRPGGVSLEELEEALGEPVPMREGGAVRSPGQLPLHYSPNADVVVVRMQNLREAAEAERRRGRRVAVATGEPLAGLAPDIESIAIPSSLEGFARSLYGVLREVDRRGCDVLVIAAPPTTGLGRAIADRLKRAAGTVADLFSQGGT